VTIYVLLFLATGVVSGVLGIGGGLLKSPLMLELGALPVVAAATVPFMVVCESSCLLLM
jgi:uncharacterized membrane protein YfcA